MKLLLILSALIAISHQQFQYRAQPREVVWLPHYSPRDVLSNYIPARLYNDYIPFRPANRIGSINFQVKEKIISRRCATPQH